MTPSLFTMFIPRVAGLVASLIIPSAACLGAGQAEASGPIAGVDESNHFESAAPSVRLLINSPKPGAKKATTSTRLLVYALPNGNTIEQTLGCRMRPGLDWHYDIQHVAAQVRQVRTLLPQERLLLLCAEAGGLSWPAWRRGAADANARIGAFLDLWRQSYAGEDARVTLAAHSGGGSFVFGAIESAEEIPAYIDRIVLLDANYAFNAPQHAAKLVRWLKGDDARRLVVVAYDDRNIMLDGKRVVGPDGGTFRATGRMIEAFKPEFELLQSQAGPFAEHAGLDGRVRFYIHPNPENKILHTALVGDMNGLVHALVLGTPAENGWGTFGGPRAYEKFIPAAALEVSAAVNEANPSPGPSLRGRGIPGRPADAVGGRAFMEQIGGLDRKEREAAILREITGGNIPDFLRKFTRVEIASGELRGVIEVTPDYLAVGSDDDFVRIPMTPQTAQRIADAWGCVLPTRKMVDAIDAAAEVRLAPQPLTEDRESVAAFLLSNEKIERQRAGKPLGALTIGAKKDVVLSPRIFERPDRVAIYGWRQLDGTPIQPLTTVHVNWYVDYSHGVRLVRDAAAVDGKPVRVSQLFADPQRHALLSDEGPVSPPRYPLGD